MPNENTGKFERVVLLKSGPWTPIPKFFFRLRRHYPDLPDSWWTSLFYILDVTLGSPGGTEGTLAYSELPVHGDQFKNWSAALEGYGRLVTRKVATYTDTKGSTFALNPEATEEDWLHFHDALRIGYHEGILDRKNKAEEVRKRFAQFREQPSHPPLWSTALMRCMAPQEDDADFKEYQATEAYKVFGELDVWDDTNWVLRGFDTMEFRRWFDRSKDTVENYLFLTELFHAAWVSSDEDDDRPLLPDDLEQLAKVVDRGRPNEVADLRPVLDKYFTRSELDGVTYLESEWLTKQWQWARTQRQLDDALVLTPNVQGEVIAQVLGEGRKKIVSRPRKQTPDE